MNDMENINRCWEAQDLCSVIETSFVTPLDSALIVGRQTTIDQCLRSGPIKGAKLAPLNGRGLAGVKHLILQMTRAKLRTQGVPQELQQLHPLGSAGFRPAHVTIDVQR